MDLGFPLAPTVWDVALRLALTALASAAIGWNRGLRGHAAGLRTVLLVGLAAAVAMVQANLLLPTDGRGPGSFGTMDLMRMPLGILTGVGFIGGGAILKRGELVTGLTTAATLWAVTAIGLCFGGGQLWLGGAATLATVVVLSPFKLIDQRVPRLRHALLLLVTDRIPDNADWALPLLRNGFHLRPMAAAMDKAAGEGRMRYALSWRGTDAQDPTPAVLVAAEQVPGLRRVELTLVDRHA